MIACRERAKKFIEEEVGLWDLPVTVCLRQGWHERLIGSADVAGKALAHPQGHLAYVAGRASL
jgi:hypothetical protein